jgi:16S rRNA (guanine(966)-N(2))-methyltransferase RsmD
VRVIGGRAGSIRLVGPSSAGTRPLSDRAREALFNILGDRVVDGSVLDLYAGTGAVGVEALSRGAARVVFVERDRVAAADISENLRRVGDRGAGDLRTADVLTYLRSPPAEPFDVVFSGPPQWDDLWRTALTAVDQAPGLVAPTGLVVTQLDPSEDGEDPPLTRLQRQDTRTYGKVRLLFHSPVASEP